MALKLTTKGMVRFSWASESMEAIWALSPDDPEETLLAKMRLIVRFVEEQQDKPPLPERIPGMALGMAQTAHPAPVGNGWAATAGVVAVAPEIPARLQGEVELIKPDEQPDA